MEVFFNCTKRKSDLLINSLSSQVDKRKKYEFHICTCYIVDQQNLKKIMQFIDEVSAYVKLSAVKLYVDSRACIHLGIDNFINFHNNLNYPFTFEIIAVDSPYLFHTKAYVLISNDLSAGALAIGSANFSSAGLFTKDRGNYETLMLTNDLRTIEDFLTFKEVKKHFKSLSQLKEYKSENYSFKYALLQQGRFVHKWSENLNQFFAIRYKLSDEGKSEIGNEFLKKLGFSVDAESISRQFINFSALDTNEVDLGRFNKLLSKGIETYIGHWIPIPLLDEVDHKYDADEIFNILTGIVFSHINENKEMISTPFEELKSRSFIAESEFHKDPIQELKDKLSRLESNPNKIYRLWYRFYEFEMPYDFSQKGDVENLYNDLMERIQSKVKKNKAIHSVLDAREKLRPNAIVEYLENHIFEDE